MAITIKKQFHVFFIVLMVFSNSMDVNKLVWGNLIGHSIYVHVFKVFF